MPTVADFVALFHPVVIELQDDGTYLVEMDCRDNPICDEVITSHFNVTGGDFWTADECVTRSGAIGRWVVSLGDYGFHYTLNECVGITDPSPDFSLALYPNAICISK
ncbi:MAG: hypothetical protein JXX14_25355 [Deltaproteobacteria bacterium]|nr:hypothetical protein [Deltaproteobacteria bacterium]